VGGDYSAFTVHRILGVIRVFPAIGATPRTKAEKLFCRALLVHVVWWVNERRVPLRFQIGLALVAQDHLGMEFILTMARHVIVVPFRDNGYETTIYFPFIVCRLPQ
jgi:hypothetical protein